MFGFNQRITFSANIPRRRVDISKRKALGLALACLASFALCPDIQAATRLGRLIEKFKPQITQVKKLFKIKKKGLLEGPTLKTSTIRHAIVIGLDGRIEKEGTGAKSETEVQNLFRNSVSRFIEKGGNSLLLHLHGANHSRNKALKLAQEYESPHLSRGTYPITIAWQTDIRSTLAGLWKRMRAQEKALQAKGISLPSVPQSSKDRWIRKLGGKTFWDELKRKAKKTLKKDHALWLIRDELRALKKKHPQMKLQLIATSAGTVMARHILQSFFFPEDQGDTLGFDLVQWKAGAEAIAEISPLLKHGFENGLIQRSIFWTLKKENEDQDRVAKVIKGSIIQLVSRALEKEMDIPLSGLERSLNEDTQIQDWIQNKRVLHLTSPNEFPKEDPRAARSVIHKDFERDPVMFESEAQWIAKPSF